MQITIRVDDPRRPEVADLLAEHLKTMRSLAPPESTHALDIDGLCSSEITFWAIWDVDRLLGCGALKELTAQHGEIKSMITAGVHRGKGIGARMLEHIVGEGRRRRYDRLSLETGAMDYFVPARALYARAGFQYCAPFGSYREDPNSVFMTLDLTALDEPKS